MRRAIILSAALAIIILGVWGTAVIYLDEARLKSVVGARLSEQLGRRVEIAGVLRIRLFPLPSIEAGRVLVGAPADAQSAAPMLSADQATMRLRLGPLLRGELAPDQVDLVGVRVNLDEGAAGGVEHDTLTALRAGGKLLAGRSLRLHDLTLTQLPAAGAGLDRLLRIDFIELDHFSLEHNATFSFRGRIGEPPILDEVRVDGQLHVPTAAGAAIRLRDMRLQARVTAIDRPLLVVGDVAVAGRRPLRLSLAAGRVQIGEHALDLSLNYHGGERPSADLLAAGEMLDWGRIDGLVMGATGVPATVVLAEMAERLDLRARLQLERLVVGAASFAQARVDLRSRSAGLGVDVAGVFPGGLADASGVLTGGLAESLAVDITLAELEQLLAALGLPAAVGGSGEARLSLEWPSADSANFRLAGQLGLWDGFWRVGRNGAEPQRQSFDRLRGDIRLTPGFLEVAPYELEGGALAGVGWAAVDLEEGGVAGELHRTGAEDSVLALSGTLARARLESIAAPRNDRETDDDDDFAKAPPPDADAIESPR